MTLPRRLMLAVLVLAATAPLSAQKLSVNARLEDLQAAAIKDSADPAAHYNLAMGYWSKKKYAQADSALHRAVDIDPQFADGYLALSIVHNWDEEYIQAIDKQGDSGYINWVRQRNRYDRKAFLLDPMVDIKILGATYAIFYRDNLTRGLEEMVEGRYDKAFAEFGKMTSGLSGKNSLGRVDRVALWYHALCAAHTAQFNLAEQDMDLLIAQHIKVDPNDTSAVLSDEDNEMRYMKATFLLRDNHPELALPLFREVAQNDLGNYMVHVQMARIYEAQRDYANALTERTNALNTNPEDASLMLDRGITLGKSGNMKEAETQLAAAYEANPRDVRSLFWLGISQSELGEKDKARASFNQFLARAPSRFDRQIAMAKDRLAKLQ